MRSIAQELKPYKIKIIYYNLEIKEEVDKLKKQYGIDCELIPWLPYKQILELKIEEYM